MGNADLFHTHSWSAQDAPRKIHQDGRLLLHHRCERCCRDFGFELDGSGWHAIYVGLMRVELLAENVSRKWLIDECPGRPLPEDEGDRATRR